MKMTPLEAGTGEIAQVGRAIENIGAIFGHDYSNSYEEMGGLYHACMKPVKEFGRIHLIPSGRKLLATACEASASTKGRRRNCTCSPRRETYSDLPPEDSLGQCTPVDASLIDGGKLGSLQ